jgi:hypothetical protein
MRKRDREFFDRHVAEFREFMREERLIADRRHREFADEFAAEMQRHAEEMRQMRADLHAHFEKQDRKIDEMVAEGKAGRAALFAILDRLNNGGTATA